MSQSSLRRSEAWFNRGLWVLSIVFAGFLIGLGGRIIEDLPKVEQRLEIENFMDKDHITPIRDALKKAELTEQAARQDLENAEFAYERAKQVSQNASETFTNWISTRNATQLPNQDAELIKCTQGLDTFKEQENLAWQAVQTQQKIVQDALNAIQYERDEISTIEDNARLRMYDVQRKVDLRVFLYRLLVTLPLICISGWLFVKKRKTKSWPFIWGFIFFSLFVFFVELIPYLPSYGGYIRYIVGIIATIIIGRYVIIALSQYLARQRLAEAQSENIRREALSYDVALTRLAKSVCPGCERTVDLKNQSIDFCPHCGIGLFNHCTKCSTRKSAFAKFCHACGIDTDGLKEKH